MTCNEQRTARSSSISFSYECSSEFPNLRSGCLTTKHGNVLTPTYMPVGTYGPVRLLSSEELVETGSQIVLGNALHLNMSPGAEVIEASGGLANFTSWNGPTLTDSGGYQVSYWWKSGTHSSEKGERKHGKESPVERIDDEGVKIRSLINGDRSFITPESAMEAQARIGADIVMAFDQPTFDTDSFDAANASLARSHAWVDRSFLSWRGLKDSGLAKEWQELFPIIQGGRYPELRRRSAEFALRYESLGIAIAGESIGIIPEVSAQTIDSIRDLIPADRPLYAMGLGGGPEGFLEAALRGVDMFDNTSPSRMARCGLALLSPENLGEAERRFRFDVTKARFRDDSTPLDQGCRCQSCRAYSRGYIRYLFSIREPLGARLVTVHNLTFMARLGEDIRNAIRIGKFGQLYQLWLGRQCGDTLE